MGKKKDKKFKAPKPHPTGLPPVKADESELMTQGCPAVVTDVLDQLQSGDELVRECGCQLLASLVAQPGALPAVMANDVVRVVAPLVVDPSPSIRHRALGALRNMTVDGGWDICHEMVLKDVLTPLVALFKQYGSNWEPDKGGAKHTDTRLDTFTQAVHILWNLCEASDTAVTVFNKENLLPMLLPCLQHSMYGYPLATAVAQCLHTVTEGNAAAVQACRSDAVLPALKSLTERTDQSSQAMLFQAALMGILMNVLGGELMSGPGLSAFVVALGMTFDVDWMTQISSYASKSVKQNGAPPASSGDATSSNDINDELSDEISHDLMEEDVFTCDEEYLNILNTLDAQRLCLELTTNICCSPEEEWEEIDSSESGSSDEMAVAVEMEQDGAADNNNFEPLCAPSEVHAAFVANNIMAKVLRLSCPLSDDLSQKLKSEKWGKKILKRLACLRTHALLCINNLVEGMAPEALGGVDSLHALWDTLGQQLPRPAPSEGASATPTPKKALTSDPDLLEAMVSALRAVIKKLAPLGSAKFGEVTGQDVRFLVHLAEGAASSVQIHVMQMVAAIALVIVKTQPAHPMVQEVGDYLLSAAANSGDVVVAAEALDALFDVFSDDATDPIARSLQLTDKLRAILPHLKAKLQSQRKNLGENYVTVSTARTNLIRFIKYKETQSK